MEWSEAIIESVWNKIGELCQISDKKLYDCLLNIQKNGGIKKDIDINPIKETFVCLWRGCINNYIFNRKQNIKFSERIISGFDIITAGIKMENK